jgi:predicted  nucleic acid-binding Zn-ribbon protein
MDQELKGMLTQIIDHLKVHDARFDAMDARFDAMDARMDMHQVEIAALKEDVTDIRSKMATKNDIAEIWATMATKEDITELKVEIADIRSKMATQDDITELKVEIADLHGKFDFVISKSKKHDKEISRLKRRRLIPRLIRIK